MNCNKDGEVPTSRESSILSFLNLARTEFPLYVVRGEVEEAYKTSVESSIYLDGDNIGVVA